MFTRVRKTGSRLLVLFILKTKNIIMKHKRKSYKNFVNHKGEKCSFEKYGDLWNIMEKE